MIIDNSKNNQLVTEIRRYLDYTQFSRMAVGYFYLSGFEAIKDKLNNVQNLKLIIGNRTNQATVDELTKGHLNADLIGKELRKQQRQNSKDKSSIIAQTKAAYIEDLAYMEQNETEEDGLKALWQLIKEKRIEIRVFTKGFLHSKAYIFEPKEQFIKGIAIVGSSNLSINGLRNNSELNVTIENQNDYLEISDWFDKIWEQSEPFDATFFDAIENSWLKKEVTPYEIYIKALYHLVKDRLEINEHTALTVFDITKLYSFQRDAYNRAIDILEHPVNPQNGVFISDVVGLGKSYIAIALISYYWSVKQKSTLIICPASLRQMWEDYKEEFHLRCKIITHTSLQYGNHHESYTLNDEEEFDGYGLVVIDEAHNFRNDKTARYKILAPYLLSKKVVLLTATPQNNNVYDVYNQIKLFHQSDITELNITPNNLKSYFKKYENHADKIAELLQNFLIRRTRRDIKNSPRYADLNIHFPKRKLNTLNYNIDQTYAVLGKESIYQKLISLLFEADNKERYQYSIYDLTGFLKPKVKKQRKYIGLSNSGELVRGLLKVLLFKRLESSVKSFYISVNRMINRNERILKGIARGYVITGDAEQLMIFFSSQDEEKVRRAEAKLNHYSIEDFNVKKLKDGINKDINILKEVNALVEPILEDYKNDDKFNQFIKTIIKKHKTEKILVFSEFSDTVDYLEKGMVEHFPNLSIQRISSRSSNSKQKADIVRRFSPKSQTKSGLKEVENEIQILITTDVLSEGQNLQDCSIVVNYDFHWNPVRLIQRIGRVDRIGSEADMIHVYNFLPDREVESKIKLRERVQNRINEIQSIFGMDNKVLSEEENWNQESVFSIYADTNEEILNAEDNILTMYDDAEQTLLSLKNKDKKEYNRIIGLQDGLRTAFKGSDKSGVFGYLRSGNLDRLYFYDGEKINDNVTEILRLIKAEPNKPKAIPYEVERYRDGMKAIYEKFKSELNDRQQEKKNSMLSTEQRHFIGRIKDSNNLFENDDLRRSQANQLLEIYQKEIPDYAKRQLRFLKREKLDDNQMLKQLRELIINARIMQFQERSIENEQMIIRTICSEGIK
jgi:superfamily II DNA or RNA helicase